MDLLCHGKCCAGQMLFAQMHDGYGLVITETTGSWNNYLLIWYKTKTGTEQEKASWLGSK